MNVIDKWKRARKLKKGDIEETLRRLEMASKKAKPGTDEFDRLRKAVEQELKNKKLVKEMRFLGVPFDRILMVGVILIIAGFGFALDMDSPKALKIAQFVLGLVKKA